MGATLGALRDAIASTLSETLQDWSIYRLPPDNVDVPAISVNGFQIDAGTFADGTVRVTTDLQVMVSRRPVDPVDLLDELLSPSGQRSLWQTFDDDPTLGGVVAFCMVMSAGEYREMTVADIGYYAASVQLSVML